MPMSADPGIVTDKCQDVMLNQTDDVVVDGLWGHYSDREWYSTIQYNTCSNNFQYVRSDLLKAVICNQQNKYIVRFVHARLYCVFNIHTYFYLCVQDRSQTPDTLSQVRQNKKFLIN